MSQSSNHLRLVSWTWQWVHFTQMTSTVTRSQSNRAALGCGGTRDSHHGCADDKSAATVWCYSWAHAHSPHCLLHHSTAAHHPWTAFPIHHCTSHTAVTNHSLALTVYTPIPGLITCTGVPHSLPYLSSLHTHCEDLFCPGWHSEHYSCFCDLPVYDPGLFTPLILCCLPLWYCSLKSWLCCCLPWLLPGIVYVSALPLIFLTLMIDHCLFDPKFIKARLQMDLHASDPSLQLSCQYGPTSLRNVSNTLLNLCHEELRPFWRQKY